LVFGDTTTIRLCPPNLDHEEGILEVERNRAPKQRDLLARGTPDDGLLAERQSRAQEPEEGFCHKVEPLGAPAREKLAACRGCFSTLIFPDSLHPHVPAQTPLQQARALPGEQAAPVGWQQRLVRVSSGWHTLLKEAVQSVDVMHAQ
jgi:hypothetical protein